MRRDRILGTALVALLPVALAVLVVFAVGRHAPPESPQGQDAGQVAPETAGPAAEDDVGLSDDTAHAETRQPAPAGLPKPSIPESLASAFDESRDLTDRMKAVDVLQGERTPEELTAIRWLLRKSDENEALRNSAARKLLECGDKHLAADLTEMLWADQETPKWRNYCVQFLKDCYDRDGDPAVLTAIFKAAEADEEKVRMCAVWSLARTATPRDKRKLPDDETLSRIRAVALDALREKNAHFLITTAGVQSCARLKLKEALPDVRKLASDKNTKPTHLRVVSLAALGDLGDDTDLQLLNRLATSATGQVKSAAALAATKIRKRAAEVDGTPIGIPGVRDSRPSF